MENLRILCKSCNLEMEGHHTKTFSCKCPNMTTICGDKITAVDLTKVVMLNYNIVKKKSNTLTNEDIAWQEARRQRKVKRLDFEVR